MGKDLKVGDIITGNEKAPYDITCEKALMRVTEVLTDPVDEDDIRIIIIDHKEEQWIDNDYTIGSIYVQKTNERFWRRKNGIKI